jgi:hypothetical protein
LSRATDIDEHDVSRVSLDLMWQEWCHLAGCPSGPNCWR